MNKKRIGEEKSREEKAGMESVCRAAGLLIAALLAYEAGKLLGGLCAQVFSGFWGGLRARLFPGLSGGFLDASGWENGLEGIFMQLGGGLPVYLIWKREGKREAKRERQCDVGKGRGLWSLLPGAAAWALGLNLLLALIGLPALFPAFQETAAAQAAMPLGAGILLYGIAAPVSEELLFRGIFYQKAEELSGRWKAAALFSSLLFGVYHGNPVQGIYGFLTGMVLCLVYEKTGRLSAAMLFHGAGNLAVYLLIDAAGLGSRLAPAVAAPLCALLLGAAALCLRRLIGRDGPRETGGKL